MKHIQTSKILFAALACVMGATATAADNAPASPSSAKAGPVTLQVKVGGSIKPGNCKPTSALDFSMQAMNPASLSEKNETPMAPVDQDLTITCTGADTMIALSAGSSTMAPTANDDALDHKGAGIKAAGKGGYIYDLVDEKGANRIGRYVFQFQGFTYKTENGKDALAADVISSTDRAAWTIAVNANDNAGQLKADGTNYISFAALKGTTPVAASSFTGKVRIGAVISPKSKLTITEKLEFRGGTTITLTYI